MTLPRWWRIRCRITLKEIPEKIPEPTFFMARSQNISPVFVEGLDVSAYGIARSVGPQGIPVYALNSSPRDALRASRYCQGCFLYANDPAQPRAYASDTVANEETLTQQLLKWSSEFSQPPVLFATSDWFARMLASRRRELESRFLFHWIEPQLFSAIADKGKMAEFCRSAGVRVPYTHVTTANDKPANIVGSVPYPCLVKPVHRYTVNFPLEAAKVFVAKNDEQLLGFFTQYPQLMGATLIQELIEGGDDQVFQCTVLVNRRGEVAAYSTVRKLRQYPVGYGSMACGRTEANERLSTEALKLVRALDYRGLGSLEFKYRQKDDGYYFIEMNTRLPWYNGIFADAGVNLAQLAYQDLTGQPPPPSAPAQRQNKTWLSFRTYRLSGRAPQQRISWARSLANVAGAKSYAWWKWRDPAPFLAASWYTLRATAGGVLRRIGLR